MATFHEKINDYVVPVCLGTAIYFLQSISVELKEMGKSLVVAVSKIDDHEKRIDRLEQRYPHHPKE